MNLEVHQLIITDNLDTQLLLMRDGVDLINQLDKLGIQLANIFQDIRDSLKTDRGTSEKPKWEKLYDSIGLSVGEIHMRHRGKRACKEAQTVSDVIALVQGTYFSVRFVSEDFKFGWG